MFNRQQHNRKKLKVGGIWHDMADNKVEIIKLEDDRVHFEILEMTEDKQHIEGLHEVIYRDTFCREWECLSETGRPRERIY